MLPKSDSLPANIPEGQMDALKFDLLDIQPYRWYYRWHERLFFELNEYRSFAGIIKT